MSVIPPCRVYDPAFAYELGAIIEDGIKVMYGDNLDVFYYLTIYNENYVQPPAAPDLDREGLIRGLYRWQPAPEGDWKHRATILFSGSAWHLAHEAAGELAEHYGVGAELWSATSFKRLRDNALGAERWNRLHPTEAPRTPFVTERLSSSVGPIVAVTDFTRAVPDMIARFVPGDYVVLGTDGFGRSDTRAALRRHFEIDAAHVVVAVLSQLALRGDVKPEAVADAIRRYDIDADTADPWDPTAH
jgi:pyruvate dehydrogenase E1 component